MEQFFRDRLALRAKQLDEYVNGAKKLLETYRKNEAITECDLVKWRLGLRQSIGIVQNEIDSNKCTEVSLFNDLLQRQIEAESILIELDTVAMSNIVTEPASSSKISTNTTHSAIKLPKLEMTKFSGDVLKWTEYWDRFEANVNAQNIKDVEKLAYLLSSLEGKAREAVEGLSITNSNYEVAVDTLRKRYGNQSKVIDSHYEALAKMSRSADVADDCRKNLNSVEKHLRVLSSLGENTDSNHLRSLILEKFPERVLYEVNILTAKDQSISSIRESLDIVIDAMERAQIRDVPPSTVPSMSTEALHINTRKVTYRRGLRTSKQFPNNQHHQDTYRAPKRTQKTREYTSAKRPKMSCLFCNGEHYNDECTVVTDVNDRRKKLKNKCFMCFRSGHQLQNCKQKRRCHYCRGDHNRALCLKRIKASGETPTTLLHSQNTPTPCPKTKSFLQTATALVLHNSRKVKCRILLDCGSQRSYITTDLAKQLDLTPEKEELLIIFTFGADKPIETQSPCSDIILHTKRGVERSLHVNVVPHITNRIPSPQIHETHGLVDILADDNSFGDQSVNLLIGNDYYFSFFRSKKIQIDNNLFLVDSDFGWLVSGCLDMEEQDDGNVLSIVTYHRSNKECLCYTEPDLPLRYSDIKFLWSLENIGITDPIKATREAEAIQHFNETVLYQDGRYYVKWPWTVYPPNLLTNYGLAYGRLKGLLHRLDEPTLLEYDDIIKEQLNSKVIEVIEAQPGTDQTVPPVHYLPHHIVKQSGKRGRIVYDASAKVKGQQSLNECMYRGPCMLQDLTALLLNFRMYKIGIVADVEKAFLQVGLQEEDRDVTRFLWVRDVNEPISNENILHLRFCRVPFGIISSPFLLTATIRHHISKTNNTLLKETANKCYVDNLVTGTNTTSQAYTLFYEAKNTFEEISMNLRDWTSNDEDFVEMIPEKSRYKQVDELKVLGLLWNKSKDTLALKVSDELFNEDGLKEITKREVLRTLASIYDPCGIVSPVLLPIKLLLQELWRKDYKWDTLLSEDLVLRWKNIIPSLREIKGVSIPRYVNADKGTHNELHCYTDASKDSYAAVVYLRSSNGSKTRTSFLISKNRVVPLDRVKKDGKKQECSNSKKKPLTIPQLELLGCVIGSRLLTYVKGILEIPIAKTYLWTDSLVVLSWINSNKLLTPFVSNRVAEIRRNKEMETYYVNTRENPADIATRPELWPQKKQVWLKGPAFLSKSKSEWPKDVHLRDHHDQALLSAVAEGLEKKTPDCTEPEATTGSDDKTTGRRNHVNSQVQEIRHLQQKFFPEELRGKETNLKRNLGLFIDIDGLLRSQGRMEHTNWSYDMKHPILLPRDSDFTNNVIKDVHERNYHVGVPHTLSLVRQQFWIPKGRAVVDRVLKKCAQCVKHGGGPYGLPATPALPPERVNFSTPFTYTGIDYFGPVYIGAGADKAKEKRWICLLTCLAVRAVHMEVVKNLTADECIMALRRFMSTRGVPAVIVSDNALYFKLSSEILSSKHCVKNKITWRFIPQLAPWHGGFYERLVGLVKHCLKRTIEKHLLGENQLLTVIKEIEAVVNTRPLTYVGADVDYVLKPADFLSLGRCLAIDPSSDQTIPSGTVTKEVLIEGWKRGQMILQEFKNMFIGQYLMNLREKYRQAPKQPRVQSHERPRVGDTVQIKGESKNREQWRVGKIAELIEGQDGEVRIAKVRVGDTEFTRSIGHLYPLEADMACNRPAKTQFVSGSPEVTDEPAEAVFIPAPDFTRRDYQDMEVEHSVEKPALEENDNSKQDKEIIIEEEPIDLNPVERVVTEETEPLQAGASEPVPEESHGTGDTEVELLEVTPVRELTSQEGKLKRGAAIRAREKIAEWTRQLFALL